MQQFFNVRGLTNHMEREYESPTYNASTGVLTYTRRHHRVRHLDHLVRRHGYYQHGTHMECLAAICKQGLLDTYSELTQPEAGPHRAGCRTLTKMKSHGVYMYRKGDGNTSSNCFPETKHGYSMYTHAFTDGWCWCCAFTVIADYEARRPSDHGQVCIPAEHVTIQKLELHVTRMAGIQHASLRPIWVGEAEAEFNTEA